MDPEDVTQLVEGLKLSTEQDDDFVELGPLLTINGDINGGIPLAKVVVGKIFDLRIINREIFQTDLPRILQTRGSPHIEIVGDNLFTVIFYNSNDRLHTLQNGLWHYYDKLMMFNELEGLQKPTEVTFTDFTTWIQCHNMPLVCMTPQIVRKVASVVGRMEEVATGEGGLCHGQYARAMVTRDINKPLKCLVRLNVGEGQETQYMLIKYKKLPEFCTACGRVWHGVSHCTDPTADKRIEKFGAWVRAQRTRM